VDHSLVQEQVNKGLITDSQAETSEYKNILTRALGSAENVEIDTLEIPQMDDDYILLCTDGLTRMLPDGNILEAVKKFAKPQDICDNLIALANEAGGRDNVTAAVAHRKSENLWDLFVKTVGKSAK